MSGIRTPDRGDMPESKGRNEAEQVSNFLTELEEISQAVYATQEPRLTAMEINARARLERVGRLGILARQSASELIPNPALHAQMNRIMDENVIIEQWERGRSATSHDLEGS